MAAISQRGRTVRCRQTGKDFCSNRKRSEASQEASSKEAGVTGTGSSFRPIAAKDFTAYTHASVLSLSVIGLLAHVALGCLTQMEFKIKTRMDYVRGQAGQGQPQRVECEVM